jgi:hypothetical protein
MPLKHAQHTQPAFAQAQIQSQHAWIMSQHALSPLVQVKHTPFLVIVQSHLHMHKLHWHISMPLMVQHRLNIPPAIILHMFCRVAVDTSSSHVQVTFMPPVHFSIFIVQRGTMHIPCIIADMPGIWPCIGDPDMPMGLLVRFRSIIIALDIATPFLPARHRADCGQGARKRWGNQTLDGIRVPLGNPVRNAGYKRKMPPKAWVGRWSYPSENLIHPANLDKTAFHEKISSLSFIL